MKVELLVMCLRIPQFPITFTVLLFELLNYFYVQKEPIVTARGTVVRRRLCFHFVCRGGVPVVQTFATRCPTDLAWGGTCSSDFCHQMSHLSGWGSKIFFSGVTSGVGGGGVPTQIFFFLVSLPVGGPKIFFFR